MTFRFFLDVPKECREAGSLSETGVNHSCKINYPHKIAAIAGLAKKNKKNALCFLSASGRFAQDLIDNYLRA